MTIMIVSCIVNSLQLSILIVILPLSLSSIVYAENWLDHRRRSRTSWSGHGLTTFQQLKENVPGLHTVYKQCNI